MSTGDDDLPGEGLDTLALALPPSRPPDPSLRSKLLGRISGRDRFLPFVDRLAKLLDLSEGEAEHHLQAIDRDDDWQDLLPGVRFRDFEGGPAIGEAHGGMVRMTTGATFPRHAHIGDERVILLQGKLQDEHGRVYRAGDMIVSRDGSSHELRAVGDGETIYAVVVVGLDFMGEA